MVWALSLSTTDLITRRLSPTLLGYGIRSLVGFGTLVGALAHSVLYLHNRTCEAIPKYISGRTSYFQVCLAFHSYPHLIPQVFNLGGFGPPSRVTETSSWTWIDHLVSGLLHATSRPIRTCFRYGSTLSGLTSLHSVTR